MQNFFDLFVSGLVYRQLLHEPLMPHFLVDFLREKLIQILFCQLIRVTEREYEKRALHISSLIHCLL